MVRANQWEIDSCLTPLAQPSNVIDTVRIGISTTEGLGGTVHLHLGSIEGIDKGDIVPYKRVQAAIDKRSLIWGSSTH